jgi:hypothetical protein
MDIISLLRRPNKKYLSLIVATIVLLFQLVLQINLAQVDSQTTDEGVHLYAGYRSLVHGDFSYNPEHPPLVKYIAAVPLLFMHVNEPVSYADYAKKTKNFFFWGDSDQSKVAEDFLFNSGNDPQKLLFWGRVPMTLMTLLLGVLVYIISVYAWGWIGGLLAVFLYTLDPTVNGHGHLVTTDIGSAIGVTISLFSFWLFLQKKNWKRAVIFGIATGLALLLKFSTLLLLPVFAVLIIYMILMRNSRFFLRQDGNKIAVAIFIAWFVLLAGYQFKLTLAPQEVSVVKAAEEVNYLQSPWLPNTPFINNSYNILRHILIPSDYLRGLISFTNHATSGHASYLLGTSSSKGWWYYFPVLFSAKLFISVIVLFILSIYGSIKNYRRYPFGTFVLVSLVFYLFFSTFSKVNIGVRHIMPVFPLMYILIGGIPIYFESLSGKLKQVGSILVGILLLIAFIECVYIYPFYLSYFNQFYGGSYQGYRTADDSNLDWGQDLYRIQNYIQKNNIQHVYLEYNWEGESSLRYFHLPYQQLTSFEQGRDHGFIIICATSLIQPTFNWLLKYPIYHQIAPGVFVYKL